MSSFHSDNQKIVKSLAIGIFSSIILIVLLTCLFGLMLKMMSGIPYSIIDYVTVGIEGFSVLIGAYIACAVTKSKGLLIGALCGGITLLLTFACGLSIADNDIGILTVIRSAVLLLCGIIGGVAGVNRKDKVRIK